jgi:hypothetical protein
MDERMREAISFSAAEARGLVQVGALGFATHEAAVVGRLGLGVPILLAALAAAERRAEQAIDWVAGLLVDIGATQSQVDTMRDHVRTKILGDNDKP